MAANDNSGREAGAALISTREQCPRCHSDAVQTWRVRRVDQPLPGLRVRRVVSSRCLRGCLDEANPWVLAAVFPSRPEYTAALASRVTYPDPASTRHPRLDDDRDDDAYSS